VKKQSREKLFLEIPAIFKPKLMICIRSVAFSGKTPKTRLQEVLLARAPYPMAYRIGENL
jgi:hypothetical protein